MCSEHKIQNTGSTVHCGVLGLALLTYGCLGAAAADAAQHQEGISGHTVLAPGRSEFKIRSMVPTECLPLSHHPKVGTM